MSTQDPLILSMNSDIFSVSLGSPECCIFRVYDKLRGQNQDAYEPASVAIGPYHQRKNHLEEMEKHKLRYLQQLLKRRNETSVENYIIALRPLEERARKNYADQVRLNTDEFVKMMLIDGCFLVELFRKYCFEGLRDSRDDPLFQFSRLGSDIRRDLLLIENQLPFFVLVELFNLTKAENQQKGIHFLAWHFLSDVLPGPQIPGASNKIPKDVKHLLHLAHEVLCFDFSELTSHFHVPHQEKEDEVFTMICSAVELRESGINIRRAEQNKILLDIEFCNGVLKVPSIAIDDVTESVLRNLIAFEQFLPDTCHRFITDYITFFHCLINSPKDVELLRRYQIIDNGVGDDAVVCKMFNKFFNNVSASMNSFSYWQVFKQINEHRKRKRNAWLANLRTNYLRNPWTIISVIAAFILLLLTLLQTIFTTLSYYK